MELEEIVESIGKLSDSAEASRWQVCESIELAYSELPAYTRGLTEALSHRLRKSSDSIYDMRDSFRMFERLRQAGYISDTPRLSSSHYSTMFELSERFEIPSDEVWEWLILAEEESLSTRDLREEISAKYREDSRKVAIRLIAKIGRLTQRFYEDLEMLGAPEDIREAAATYKSIGADFFDKVNAWLG
jgi:hypothetical protein